jgi:hypothetical protein
MHMLDPAGAYWPAVHLELAKLAVSLPVGQAVPAGHMMQDPAANAPAPPIKNNAKNNFFILSS